MKKEDGKELLKTLVISILIVVPIIAMIFAWTNKDWYRFKHEYENLNGEEKYEELKLKKTNLIEYVSPENLLEILKSGTEIIYLGFPECPWCRSVMPSLIKSAEKTNTQIKYLNIKDLRDKKELEDGKIIVKNEGAKSYKEMLKILNQHLDVYEGLNDDSIKRIYAPTVIAIKEGKFIKKHVGSLDGQEDPRKKLSEKELKELEKIYEDLFNSIKL